MRRLLGIAFALLFPASWAVSAEQPDLVFNLSSQKCGDAFIYRAEALVFGPIPAAFTAVLDEAPPAGEETARERFREVYGELERINGVFSLYVDGSEIRRFNSWGQGEPFVASSEFYTLLVRSLVFWRASGGAFDPTVEPVIDVYRRMRKGEAVLDDEVRAARSIVGMGGLAFLPRNRLLKPPLGLGVDMGGIAKGYGVERAVALLKAGGVKSGIVEIGGDLKVFGAKPDVAPWEIGITDPLRPQRLAAVLSLSAGKEVAVVTSGDYQRKYRIGDKVLTHIVNPFSGRPIEYQGRGITLMTGDTAAADALATACFVLPEESAFDLAGRQGAALLFVSGGRDGSLSFRKNRRLEEMSISIKVVGE